MRTLDIPQANDLASVRRIVHAVAHESRTQAAVMAFTDFSRRHAQYRIQAARVLGLLRVDDGSDLWVATLGERLLETERGTPAELAVWHDAITFSRALQIIAPDLLTPRGPGLEELTSRIVEMSELSASTARRRANGLLTWRRYVLDLPDVDLSDAEQSILLAKPELESTPAPAPEAKPAVVVERQLDLFG